MATGLSLRPFSRQIGVPVGVLRSYLDGRDITASNLAMLCNALGVSITFWEQHSHVRIVEFIQNQLGELNDPNGPIKVAERLTELHNKAIGQDLEAIPRYDVFLAAGSGAINDENAPVEHLVFSKAWLHRMSVSSGMAALLSVKGDSM